MTTYLVAETNGNIHVVGTEDASILTSYAIVEQLSDGQSTLALRYKVVDGKITDAYPNVSDADVIAQIQESHMANSQTLAAQANIVTTVSPVEFLLLFTAQERVGIKQSTDPIIEDFLSIINNPHLTVVDLTLNSTKEALEYMSSLMPPLLSQSRIAEILSGKAR